MSANEDLPSFVCLAKKTSKTKNKKEKENKRNILVASASEWLVNKSKEKYLYTQTHIAEYNIHS